MAEASATEWCETSAKALLETFRAAMATRGGNFAERERQALALLNELGRQWTEHELNQMADRYAQEVVVDGRRYRRHSEGERGYHTLCGTVGVRRALYRQVGIHNGPTVVPLELEAGIVENATPSLLVSVMKGYAAMPLREYAAQMAAAQRVIPSQSTLGRISKRHGTTLHEALYVIEPALRSEEALPAEVKSISIGIDRTAMRMFEWLPRLPDRWSRGGKRPPRPCTVMFRMPYVATLTLNDGDGAAIKTTRFAATVAEGPVEMMERLGAELQHVLARARVPVVVVQDGAPELWNLVEEWLGTFDVPIEMKLIDRYHVEERLAQVAEIVERDEATRHRLLAQWRQWLDDSDRGINKICEHITVRVYEPARRWKPDRAYLTLFGEPDEDMLWLEPQPRIASATLVKKVDGHLGYFRRYAKHMHYKTARARGFPIGSGPTEGACKSVVGTRCKRSGQRWAEAGASACLHVRTLALSDRLERAIEFHANGQRQRVDAA